MAALRATICNALNGGWKRNVGIQALWGLTTVAEQPGEIAAGTLKPLHIYIKSQKGKMKRFCMRLQTNLLNEELRYTKYASSLKRKMGNASLMNKNFWSYLGSKCTFLW